MIILIVLLAMIYQIDLCIYYASQKRTLSAETNCITPTTSAAQCTVVCTCKSVRCHCKTKMPAVSVLYSVVYVTVLSPSSSSPVHAILFEDTRPLYCHYETVGGRETCLNALDCLNKHCSKILQETFLNSVSNNFLPFVVGQSHVSFTVLSVKDVMLFQHCQQAIQVLCTGYRQEAL
jgi:hypothetical protein